MKKDPHKYATKLVNNCAIPPHLSGFTFLSEAVVIKSEESTIKLKELYARIARRHHNTPRAVTRSIRYAISQSETICDYLAVDESYLFNSRVIAALALKLRSLDRDD